MKGILLFLVVLLLMPSIASATNIYIDPSINDPDEDGSFEHPYNSWRDFTITGGNDYYQKCGTTWVNDWSGAITIDASGTDSDHIVIGAYYDDGGPVIESDNPSFGEFCVNGDPKPILTGTDYEGAVLLIDGQYIELNSIQVKMGATTIYVKNSNNIIKYCQVGWGEWGIRVGLSNHINGDYNYIGYNYVYTDTGIPSVDGIQLSSLSSYSIVEYNVLDGWNHCSLSSSGGHNGYNILRYNAIYSWDDLSNECICIGNNYAKVHHNYCKDAGLIQFQGENIEIAYNVMDGHDTYGYIHPGLIQFSVTALDILDCKVYNNVIYDRRDGITMAGIRIHTNVLDYYGNTNTNIVERNEIFNNIILNFDNTDRPPFYITDSSNTIESNPNDPDVNIWRNNLAHDYTNPNYMLVEGTYYASASDFNTNYGAAFNNRGDDPGLSNPASGEFWPDDSSDNVVGTGYSDCDDCIDQLLDPVNSDLTAFPPKIVTVSQPAEWYIGAFALSGVECTENWTCTDWSCFSCVDDHQDCTRTCIDQEACVTENNRPHEFETRACGTGDLVGHWTFDSSDISGDQIIDVSGLGNHGTIHGAVAATGRVGEALYFDGEGNYVVVDNDSLNVDYLTASLWFRADDLTDNAGLFAKGDNSHRQYWTWIYGGNLSAEIDEGNDHNYLYPLQTNMWHHLAVTYNGSRVIIYINGTEISSIAQSTGTVLSDDDPLIIGRLPGFQYFNGTIDDVMIWNRSLSSTEILDLYDSSFHMADTSPKDGCVEEHELIPFIDLWRYDSTTNPMGEVMEAVTLWSKGTGCPQ